MILWSDKMNKFKYHGLKSQHLAKSNTKYKTAFLMLMMISWWSSWREISQQKLQLLIELTISEHYYLWEMGTDSSHMGNPET